MTKEYGTKFIGFSERTGKKGPKSILFYLKEGSLNRAISIPYREIMKALEWEKYQPNIRYRKGKK